jgi:Lectin C-type domain
MACSIPAGYGQQCTPLTYGPFMAMWRFDCGGNRPRYALDMKLMFGFFVASLGWVSSAHGGVVAGPITNPSNGHAYYVISRGSWTVSEAVAQSLGGHLATIRSAAENSWIVSNVAVDYSGTGGPNASSVPLWIGIYDPVYGDGGGAQHAANFVWASGEPITYTNWNPDTGIGPDPNNARGLEYYGTINWHYAYGGFPAGTWNDCPLEGNGPDSAHPNTDGPYYGIVEVVPEPTVGLVGLVLTLTSRLRPRHGRSSGAAKRVVDFYFGGRT